jgi:hypothetical protein
MTCREDAIDLIAQRLRSKLSWRSMPNVVAWEDLDERQREDWRFETTQLIAPYNDFVDEWLDAVHTEHWIDDPREQLPQYWREEVSRAS